MNNWFLEVMEILHLESLSQDSVFFIRFALSQIELNGLIEEKILGGILRSK